MHFLNTHKFLFQPQFQMTCYITELTYMRQLYRHSINQDNTLK